MSSIRLRPEQITRLRESGQGPAIIRLAVKRWRRGDFVIGNKKEKRNKENLLQIYPVWGKPDGVSDWQLRQILDAHFSTPDSGRIKQINKELAYWDGIVEAELARLAALGPVIFE